jgi:AbrB family looped-hinge helix DNA binding protein
MKTTIDRAGRLVIPKNLRDQVGLREGAVEVTRDGSGIRIEPAAGDRTATKGGRLVIDDEIALSDEAVRSLRLADQR